MATKLSNNPYKEKAQIEKALKLVATAAALEEEKPCPAPVGLLLAQYDEKEWEHLARIARVNLPSAEVRELCAVLALTYEESVRRKKAGISPFPK